MDVHCTSCGEPWDVYHLRHDAIYETGADHAAAEAWSKLSSAKKLSSFFRAQFKVVGWEFGTSVLDVRHCPACRKDAEPDAEKEAIKSAIVEALGDDEDGIASTMEDFGL